MNKFKIYKISSMVLMIFAIILGALYFYNERLLDIYIYTYVRMLHNTVY